MKIRVLKPSAVPFKVPPVDEWHYRASDTVEVDLDEALTAYDIYFHEAYLDNRPLDFGEWVSSIYITRRIRYEQDRAKNSK
jgi:hypothetical protein